MTEVGAWRVIPCPEWCSYQDAADESCFSKERRVPASRYPRQKGAAGNEWGDEYFSVSSQFYRPTGETIMLLGLGENAALELTTTEARLLSTMLLVVADELEEATK